METSPANDFVRSGRGLMAAPGRLCAFAGISLLAFLFCAPAAPLQVAGNFAFLPSALGELKVVRLNDGTNTTVLSTNADIAGISGIAVQSHYAFVSITNEGLMVFDVATQPPVLVTDGRFLTSGAANDVRVMTDMAFIADGAAGIAIVDVFDPLAPLNLGLIGLDPAGMVLSLDVASNRVYAACDTAGLQIYDITDVGDVQVLGSRITASASRRVRVAGNFAFVACAGGRLEIINIQNPATPVLVSTYRGGGSLRDVDVAGNFAVLANANGALTVLNVSNPAAPIPQSTNTIAGGALAVRVVGENAYVRNGDGNLVVVRLAALSVAAPYLREEVQPVLVAAGQTAVLSVLAVGTPPLTFQWSKDGVPLSDDNRISGPTNAWLVLSPSILADTGIYSVTVSNTFGQVASSNVLTVVNPGTPVLRGAFDPGGSAEALDLADSMAYVAAGTNGLEVFDVRNPRRPLRMSNGSEVSGFSEGIRVFGAAAEYAFMATGTNGLQVFNIIPNEQPTLISATDTPGTSRSVFLEGGRAYLADGENGLLVFALSDNLQPTFVSAYDTPGYAWNIFVADNIVYIAEGTNGIQILSVTNPAAITPLGTYNTPGEARNVKVFAGKAYVADGDGGLLVLNVANPANPTPLGRDTNAVPALDLEFADNTVILAKGANGVESLDVSDPAAIVSLGANLAAVPANALRVQGNLVYVAAGTNGVKILELIGLNPPYPETNFTPPDQVVLPGGTVIFPVGATGTAPLAYQWFKDGFAVFDTGTTHGTGTDTLTLSNLVLTSTGEYSVVVRNAWNLSVSTSVNLHVVPVGTPVFRSGYFDPGDALNTHVVGQTAFVASRTSGLLAVDWRDALDPVLIGQHPTLDLAQDVEVHGRYAYVASWKAGLEIFDVLDPTNLVRVGHCDTPGLAHKVRVSGNRAFVADRAGANGTGGLAIIDVSDPTRPGLIGMAATAGFAAGVDVRGNKAFVAASQAGLEVFDASNPLAPVRIAQLDTPGTAESITLADNRAYLSDYNHGLQIVDVINPAAPVKLGEYQTAGDAFHVQIVSNLAYIAEGIRRVEIVDVSNASAPALVTTSLAGDSVHGLQIIGQHALLADRESGWLVAELLGFAPIAPAIVEFPTNVTETAGRELVLSVACEGTPPLSYAWCLNSSPLTNTDNLTGVNNRHLRFANLAATNGGNYTVIISNAQGSVTSAVASVTVTGYGVPVARGVFDTPGRAMATTASGNMAFIADGAATVRFADLSNVDQPVALGSYAATGIVYGVCLQTNLLFLALGTNGVEIVDVSNPAQPVRVSAFDTPGTALNLYATDGRLCVADGESGLLICDVTDPTKPVTLGALDTSGLASDVRAIGDLAFVADGSAGLQIISVTNPAVPVLIGSYNDGGNANAVRIAGNRAYVANGGGGLLILDISIPSFPVALGVYSTENALALEVAGNLVVLADGIAGYLVLDATNPAGVVPVGGSASVDAITGVTLVGNLAFLSSGTEGLKLVELSGVSPLAPAFLSQPVSAAVLHGQTVQFQALPAGTPPLTYRWYHDSLPLFDGDHVSGVATTHLTVNNVTLQDAGSYTFRVLNPWGVTNSAIAQLRFIGPLQAQIDAGATGAVINLSPGIYTEPLLLDKSVTLSGPWWDRPVLSGAGLDTVLHVLPGANVTLRGLMVREGVALNGSGGGILNEGSLILDHCVVANNAAGSGAGIANAGTLVMVSSLISNNTAAAFGGGIYNEPGATALVTNCTVTANIAEEGAGMFNQGNGTLVSSLVSSNLASGLMGNGGGFRSLAGLLQLINCTVSGNFAQSPDSLPAAGLGGGVCVDGGSLEFHSTTVAFNTAATAGGGVSIASPAQVRSGNSLFAANTAPDSADCGGTINSDGHNLVQDSVGLALAGVATGDTWDVDARLGPLRDNGGPTLTHALLADSPAIDGGAAPGPATDARGLARPFDIPWIPNADDGLDIGAFEFIDPSPYLILSNRTSAGFTLAWAANSVLQETSALPDGWVDLTNASPLIVSTLNDGQSFFRLRTVTVPAVLTINNETTNSFLLSWPGAGILEHAPAPGGPWESLTGISPYPVAIDLGANEFFRLRVIEH